MECESWPFSLYKSFSTVKRRRHLDSADGTGRKLSEPPPFSLQLASPHFGVYKDLKYIVRSSCVNYVRFRPLTSLSDLTMPTGQLSLLSPPYTL